MAAFAGGAISFLSPCVLPLVPGYLAYVAGRTVDGTEGGKSRPRRAVFGYGVWFVLGFSTVFVLLGAGANVLSHWLLQYRDEANMAGGALIILFGLFTTGVLRIPVFERDVRWHGNLTGGSTTGAYLLGLAFAFGWTPCIGPILGSILMATAASASTDGIVLLAVYSLGLGLPFLLAALFTEGLLTRMRTMRKTGQVLQIVAGLGMIAMGLAMMTGRLTDLALWLLLAFPNLGTMG